MEHARQAAAEAVVRVDDVLRFVIVKESEDRYRFEQSFSADGGEHWELNWVATDTRRKAAE